MNQKNRIICEKRIWTDTKLIHTHNYGHLIFPLNRPLTMKTKHQSVTVNDCALFYLPPECPHVFFSQADYSECLVVDVPVFVVSTINRLSGESGRCLPVDANWRALRSLFLTESNRKDPSVNHLLYHSFHLLQKEEELPSLRYIHDHYFENISMQTLASLEHYNVAYYGQWFQKKMGVTPRQYIQQLRFDEAKRLLRETNFSISDITQQVGYQHQSYLTRILKQIEGMSPLQYRSYYKDKKI